MSKPKIRFKARINKNEAANQTAHSHILRSQSEIEGAKGDKSLKTLIGMSLLIAATAILASVIVSAIAG